MQVTNETKSTRYKIKHHDAFAADYTQCNGGREVAAPQGVPTVCKTRILEINRKEKAA
jgi:hypothetical protein